MANCSSETAAMLAKDPPERICPTIPPFDAESISAPPTLPSDDEDNDNEEETKTVCTEKTPWKSIVLMGLFNLCTGLQFGLYFSSIWPYMQTLDPDVSETFLGYCIAVYSLGQIITAPIAGYVSNRMRSVRIPIVGCIFLQMLGNIIYVCAQLPSENRRYGILLARFVNGIGASNIGLLKTYIASASTLKDRSRAIAVGTGGLALGLAIGPAIQLIFVPIDYPGWKVTQRFLISMYTAPGIFACLVNLTAILVMIFVFEEKYAGLANHHKTGEDRVSIPPFDRLAIFICYCARFTQMFIFTNTETLSTPFAMSFFAWPKNETVTNVSAAHVAVSIVELIMYVSFVAFKLDRWINYRLNCTVGYLGLFVFYLATFSWPFLSGNLITYTENDYQSFLSGNASEPVGCNIDRLRWCSEVRPINVWVFYASYVFFMGACFCIINITLNTIFSQVLGPRRQGTHQGVLQMVGSCGRMMGPLIIRLGFLVFGMTFSNLYTMWGPRAAWGIQMVILAITIALWILFYDRLIPLEVPTATSPPTTSSPRKSRGVSPASDLKPKSIRM